MGYESDPMVNYSQENYKDGLFGSIMKLVEIILQFYHLLLSHLDQTKCHADCFEINTYSFLVVFQHSNLLIEMKGVLHHISLQR